MSQACRGTAFVCGWWWDPLLVFLVAWLCSWCLCGPRMLPAALSHGPCPTAPAVHACWPLPTTSGLFPHPACVTALCSLPLSGAELASPHVGVVPRPLLASGIPEAGWCVGSLVCVWDMGAAGAWRETVLPGWLVVLGCVLVVVGVSTRKGAGGCQSVVLGVLWDGPCTGRHLVVTSCGGPWWLTCASPTPPWVALSPAPRGGVWPTPPTRPPFNGVGHVWLHPVGVLLRLSVCLSLLAVCCSLGLCPGVSRFQACHGPDPLPVLPPPVHYHCCMLDEGELL